MSVNDIFTLSRLFHRMDISTAVANETTGTDKESNTGKARRISYTKQQLVQLRDSNMPMDPKVVLRIPAEIRAVETVFRYSRQQMLAIKSSEFGHGPEIMRQIPGFLRNRKRDLKDVSNQGPVDSKPRSEGIMLDNENSNGFNPVRIRYSRQQLLELRNKQHEDSSTTTTTVHSTSKIGSNIPNVIRNCHHQL